LTEEQPDYSVVFVDVGQGDAALISHLAFNHSLLVDIANFKPIKPFLEKNDKLKAIFISHWDYDHVDGLPELFDWLKQNRKKCTLFVNKQNLQNSHARRISQRLHEACHEGVLSCKQAHSDQNGHEFGILKGRMSVLWPPYANWFGNIDDRNQDSLILLFEAGAFRLLLGGDAPGAVWADLHGNASGRLQADILKFPHHGGALKKASGDWDADTLISNVAPQFIVISVGKNNQYKHPSKEFRQAEQRHSRRKFLYTSEVGNIEFSIESKTGKMTI